MNEAIKKRKPKERLCDEKSNRERFGPKRMGSRRDQKERASGEATRR